MNKNGVITLRPHIHNIASAAQANAIHQQIKTLGKLMLADAIAIGKFLVYQKSKVKHGGWQDWMKDNLQFTERTAQRYMLFFEHRDELEEDTLLLVDDAKTTDRSDLDNPTPAAVPATITKARNLLTKTSSRKAVAKPARKNPTPSTNPAAEWQPHPNAKREIVDDTGPGEIMKITNPDGTERWQFIPPTEMDVEIPEEQALQIIEEGIDGWLTSLGKEQGGKVAQKLLLTIGLWAIENDRVQAIATFEDCVRLADKD
jgi:hypothetical protein